MTRPQDLDDRVAARETSRYSHKRVRAGQYALVLVLSRNDVEKLLDRDELVDALADAMADVSANRASMPPRGAAMLSEQDGMLAAMPAFLPSRQALTTKLVSGSP
jgi:ornithine cyclodeaminase/alanine dehydrogenase-like protein (mu-crystallin family)